MIPTPADLEALRIALQDQNCGRKSKERDAGMKMNSLRRRLGVEVIQEMTAELKKAGQA